METNITNASATTHKAHILLEVKVAILVEISLTKQLGDHGVGKSVSVPGLHEALLDHHQGHGAAFVCILSAPELLRDS